MPATRTHRKTSRRRKLDERPGKHTLQRTNPAQGSERSTTVDHSRFGRDFAVTIEVDDKIKKAHPLLTGMRLTRNFDAFKQEPFENTIDFIKYLHKCILNLPNYQNQREANEISLLRTIKDVNDPNEVCLAMVNYLEDVLTSLSEHSMCDFSWGDPIKNGYGNGSRGTKSSPIYLHAIVSDMRTNFQEAAFLEACFLPQLKHTNKPLHDILVRVFSHLIRDCGMYHFGQYYEWCCNRLDQEAGEIWENAYTEAEQENSRRVIEEGIDESELPDPEAIADDDGYLVGIKETYKYWTNKTGEVQSYIRLLQKKYSLVGTKRMIKAYPWKAKRHSHLKTWIDQILPLIEKRVDVENYSKPFPSYSDSGEILPERYYVIRWGTDDHVENWFDDDMQANWENSGFSPMRRSFDLAKEKLEFEYSKKGRTVDVKWNYNDDALNLAKAIRNGAELFDRMSAIHNFDIKKIAKHYHNGKPDQRI